MALIKSQFAPQAAPFQWRDIEAEARQLIEDAKQRSEAILQHAQVTAESLTEAARAEGYRRGHAEGVADGSEQGCRLAVDNHARQLESAIAALNEAAGQLTEARQKIRADATREMVDLAIALARRVTKRQAAVDPQVLVANLRESFGLAARGVPLRIAIHPSQREVLSDALPRLKLEWPSLETAQIVDDPQLSVGGCRLLTEHGRIDADLDSQFERVVSNLIPPQSPEAT